MVTTQHHVKLMFMQVGRAAGRCWSVTRGYGVYRLLVAGGWWRARREMGAVVRSYDASGVGAPLLTSLVACGASDVALAVARSQAASQVCSANL